MNIKEIDKWLDNEYGCSYTKLEELHNYWFEKSTDQKLEIERLKDVYEKNLQLVDKLYLKDKEIERLNNIINGMEEFFKYEFEEEVRPLNSFKVSVWTICLDKLQELKGDGSNE